MKKYAVIQLSGKQFLVNNGDVWEVERQPKSPKIDVLMYFDGKKYNIGEPTLKDTPVKVTNIEDKKAKKIRVARFKSKSRYRKVKGHRQPISVVKAEFGGDKPAVASAKSRSTSSGKATVDKSTKTSSVKKVSTAKKSATSAKSKKVVKEKTD